jgi:hypothetical protein
MSCQGQPLPLAFVKRDFDETVIGNFMKKKYLALSQFIGKPETSFLYFSAADFKDLFNRIAGQPGAAGIKVHFATWCPTGEPAVDNIVMSGYKDLLTVVFVPVDQNRTEIEKFFIVSPVGGVLELTQNAASQLVHAFLKIKLPLLQEIIYDAGRPDFMETHSLYYELEKFNGPYGLIKEMDAQQAAGMAAFIGSYAKDTTKPGAGGITYPIGWQLTVIFEFAKTLNYNGIDYLYHFDIEDTGGFNTRPPAPAPPSKTVSPSAYSADEFCGGDTTDPCPPPTPCSSTLGLIRSVLG